MFGLHAVNRKNLIDMGNGVPVMAEGPGADKMREDARRRKEAADQAHLSAWLLSKAQEDLALITALLSPPAEKSSE